MAQRYCARIGDTAIVPACAGHYVVAIGERKNAIIADEIAGGGANK
jgi:hypothetical protein